MYTRCTVSFKQTQCTEQSSR